MRKVAQKHVIAINVLMLQTAAQYINTFVSSDQDADNEMYAQDIAYNTNALVEFNNTKNVQQLHDSIMQQDTIVREFYIDTLRYIEDNNLIPAYNFCCK